MREVAADHQAAVRRGRPGDQDQSLPHGKKRAVNEALATA
jgi:hypothetical protein